MFADTLLRIGTFGGVTAAFLFYYNIILPELDQLIFKYKLNQAIKKWKKERV